MIEGPPTGVQVTEFRDHTVWRDNGRWHQSAGRSDAAALHIVSTNAQASHAVAGGVTVRATTSGELNTKLSEREGVPGHGRGATGLRHHRLGPHRPVLATERHRWGPVRTETIDGLTTVNRKTSTVKTAINVTLDTLTTRDKIPEVGKAVPGTGHYEATFNWD